MFIEIRYPKFIYQTDLLASKASSFCFYVNPYSYSITFLEKK